MACARRAAPKTGPARLIGPFQGHVASEALTGPAERGLSAE